MSPTERNIRDSTVLLTGCFFLVVSLCGFWMAMDAASGAIDAAERAERMAGKLAEGFDPVFEAVWIEHRCPKIIGAAIPAGLRPVACEPAVQVERSGDLDKLRKSIPDEAAGLTVFEERGQFSKELVVSRRLEIKPKKRRGLW